MNRQFPSLAWGKKVSQDFRETIYDICMDFAWDNDLANALMSCIAFESGETFSPSVKNAAGSGATGLIQFMPSTARGLGTTTESLAAMSAVEQLQYVRDYFRPYAHRISTINDMYMAILLPKYVGASQDSILFNSGTVAYRQNSGLDLNTDGKVTKAEAASKVAAKLAKGLTGKYLYVETQ